MKNGNGEMKIERGIPIPAARSNHGYSDALRKLKVGESVVLPCSNQTARALIYQILRSKRTPFKGEFTGRKLDGDHTRVWRIK